MARSLHYPETFAAKLLEMVRTGGRWFRAVERNQALVLGMSRVSGKIGCLIAGGWSAVGPGTAVLGLVDRLTGGVGPKRHAGGAHIPRFLLAVAMVAAAPIAGLGPTASAGFVLTVRDGKAAIFGEDGARIGNFDITPDSCRRTESRPQESPPPSEGVSWLRYHHEPVSPPLPPLAPPKAPPTDSNACQGLGGSSTNWGSSTGPHAAGLPGVLAVTGPVLATRLFARESRLHTPPPAGRLFRPPR